MRENCIPLTNVPRGKTQKKSKLLESGGFDGFGDGFQGDLMYNQGSYVLNLLVSKNIC